MAASALSGEPKRLRENRLASGHAAHRRPMRNARLHQRHVTEYFLLERIRHPVRTAHCNVAAMERPFAAQQTRYMVSFCNFPKLHHAAVEWVTEFGGSCQPPRKNMAADNLAWASPAVDGQTDAIRSLRCRRQNLAGMYCQIPDLRTSAIQLRLRRLGRTDCFLSHIRFVHRCDLRDGSGWR